MWRIPLAPVRLQEDRTIRDRTIWTGHGRRVALCLACCFWVSLAVARVASAQTPAAPLHERIDREITQAHVGPLSPLCSDADFVRRVYLDLIGVVPSSAETRAFLADAASDKRTRLVDALLAHPRHAQHMANAFDVMLMERRGDKHVPAAEWQKYLVDSFAANKPYDVLVREILSSDGTDPSTRPAAKFVLDREAEPNLMARDVGRIFFGRDLQCAQCHDHPLVADYYQADYYGLYAFFSRTALFTTPDKDKKVVLMDNAAGEVSFQSVFDLAAKGNTLPRAPGNKQAEELRFNAGEEWTVAPAKDTRHVPKYSRRAQLAAQVASPANRQFNRNIVNRLWAQVMGAGLVEPVDLHHIGNPPTHPALLEMLADDFVAMKYDVRAFLRELVLSQTYQRALDSPDNLAAQASAAGGALAALEAEQARVAATIDVSKAAQAAVAANLTTARRTIPPIAEELDKCTAQVADAKKAIEAANKGLTEARGKLTPKQEVATSVLEAAAKAKEAAAKLPGEKELAEAAAKFQTKADQLNAEIAPLVKAVDERAVAVKASEDKLAAINQSLADTTARLDAARKPVITLELDEEVAAEKARADRFAAKLAERRLAEAKTQSQYAVAIAALKDAQPAIDKLAADFTTGKQSTVKLAADMPALQAAQNAATQVHAAAQSSAAAAKQTLDAKEAARKEFAEVLAKADAAAKKLPDDAELKQTQQKLQVRSDQLVAEAVEAQKACAALDDAAKAAAAGQTAAAVALASATNQMTSLAQSLPAMETQLAAARQKVAADALAVQQAASEFPERWSREFATRLLRQLTPEQLGWSMLRATGVYENEAAAVAAELEKTTPLTDAIKNDPAQLAARQRQLEANLYAKLAPNVAVFVQLFGAGAGQPQSDFFATVDQALFLANGGVVKGWLNPGGENLSARLLKLEDARQLADELYLSVLTRRPSDAEATEVAKYLASRPTEKNVVVQELAWSLLSSAEFRFNH